MNSRTLKVEKPKSKYTQSTINLSYKGNASELQSKPSIRQGGLQLVGKLQGTRRNPPPPPWIPSLKAEMGGQDTRINLVPPGGSGWGTGPNSASTSQPGSTTTTSTILKDDVKGEPKAGSENVAADCSTEQSQLNSLAKPPQKPFFAPRPKVASSRSGADSLQESISGLAMSTGPTVPFYHRQPTATTSVPDTPLPTSPSTNDLPVGEDSTQDKTGSSNPSTVHTGWAAVTTEEPDFQERINFSDDEEAETSCSSSVNRTQQPPATEPCWTDSLSSQQTTKTPTACLPQTAWKAPPPTIASSAPTVVSVPTNYGASPDHIYHSANGNVMIPESPMMRDPLSAVQAFGAMSIYNTDAQLQAQREVRTREYQHAVNRALMERRKTSYMEASEPKPVESSPATLTKTIADSHMFLQSQISSSSSQPPQQPNIASVIAAVAAVYGNSFQNLLPNMAAGKNAIPFQPKPPSAQPPVVQPPWPAASFSSQPQFMQQFPFPVSTAPKVANQAPCLNTELILEKLLEACKTQAPTDVPVGQKTTISRPGDLAEKQSEEADSMFRVPSHGPSESELIDNQMTEFSQRKPSVHLRENFESLSKHAAESNSPICDTDKVSGAKSQHAVETVNRLTDSPPASDSTVPPQTQHITPLMEVDLSNKWTDKDFNAFEASSPSFQQGLNMKSSKGTRGGRSAQTRGPASLATSSVDASEKIAAYRNPERKPKQSRFGEVRSKDVKRGRNYPLKGRHVGQQSLTSSSTWNNVTDDYDQFGDENGDVGTSEEPYASTYQPKRTDSSRQSQFTHNANTDGTSGTFPRTQRGHRGVSGRFTRSGHVTGYEDYYNKGYSNHQESSFADAGGQCDSDVAPRHPQPVSYSRGKHRGHSGFQANRKGDSDEGHHGYTKSKSIRQFSRSGDPSQRYRDEQSADGGDQRNDQSSLLARASPKASNSFRQREDGQSMTTQHDGRPTARRPPKNSKSGNRQVVQSGDADDVDLSCLPTTSTTSEAETGVDQNAGGPSSNSRTAQSVAEESFKHTSSNSRRGFKSCPRTRRPVGGGRYRNQGPQQFRSTEEGVRPRRDKINRHPDDDHDEGGNNAGIAGRSGSGGGGGGTGTCSTSTTGVGNGNDQSVRQTNSSGEVNSEQAVDEPTTGEVGDSTPECAPVESDAKDDPEVNLEINNSSALVKPSLHLSPTNGSNNQYHKYLLPRRNEGAYSGNSFTDRRGRTDRYGKSRFENRSRGHPSLNGTSVIVPLMSINAEAPPSFCNNPSFLDSPSDDSPSASNPTDGEHQAVHPPEQDGDTASAATNTESSNDGFTEVRSKSSKKQRRLQKKTQSAVSNDKKSVSPVDPERQCGSTKTSGRESVKSRGQSLGPPKSENKNQKRQNGEASQKTKQSESVSQPPPKTPPAKKTPKKPPVAKNAWTTPLQTTISAPTKTDVSNAGAVETSKTSYAWSKVVGSKVLSSEGSASNNGPPTSKPDNGASVNSLEDPSAKPKSKASFSPSQSPPISTQAPSERPATSEALKSGTSSVVESLRDSVEYSSSALWYSSEKVQAYDNRPPFQPGTSQNPVTSASSSGVAIANVCKVRPQKQPQPVSSPSAVTTCSRQTASPVQTSVQSSGPDAFLALNSSARRDEETASTHTAPPGISFSYSATQSRSSPAPEYNQFSQRAQQKQSNKSSPSFYDVEPASSETVTPWPSTSKAYGFQPSALNQHLQQANLPLDIYSEQPPISAAKGCLNMDSDGMMTAATAAMFMHHPHAVSAPYRHSLPQMPIGQQPQGSSLMGLNVADLPRQQNARTDSQNEGFMPPYPAAAPNASSQMRGLYSLVQPPQQPQPMHPGPRNYTQWPASGLENLHSAQQASGMLLPPSQNVPGPMLPSQFGPGYHHHQHPPQQPTHGFAPIVSNSYVGVIGSDRPSSTHGQQNRIHSGQLQQPPMYGAAPTQPPICGPLASTGFLPPSLYGRNLAGAGSSPTHPTPPPHGGINAFDHNFAMTGGLHGCSPHSSGLFSQPTGHPSTHRQHMHGNSPSSSSTDVVPGAAVCINPHSGFALQVPVPPTGAPLGGGHAGFPY